MKLVDILARDLWDWWWPDNICALSQDSDGFVGGVADDEMEDLHFCQGDWSSSANGYLGRHELSDDYSTSVITRQQWRLAVDALNAPKSAEWNGSGLPPARTACEFSPHKYPDFWRAGIIRYISKDICVIEAGESREVIEHPTALKFRPIRTPEQIAAEEREKAMKPLADLIDRRLDLGPIAASGMAGFIYDAGYRKLEIVEGE